MYYTDFPVSVDIELTNRCNAKCHFCPRDATPHQGLMTAEVFDQSLARAVEVRDAIHGVDGDKQVNVSLCGLGEPLLNRQAPTFVRQVREAGLRCGLSSNGALLDESRSEALLDAGLQQIYLNVGDIGETYEAVYQLPWQRTLDNVVAFKESARGRCAVTIVLVDHHRDPEHLESMRSFWRGHGIESFVEFDIMNRGGTLFIDEMQYGVYPEQAEAESLFAAHEGGSTCSIPFFFLFIGYDGLYYLCCSDWKKEVPLGSVFDSSFLDITRTKFEHVSSREPICKTCNHDPLNRLTEELRLGAAGPGETDAAGLAGEIVAFGRSVTDWVEQLQPGVTADPPAPTSQRRRMIPVASTT